MGTMFGGGESHAASVEMQRNSAFGKLRSARCVLGRKDTEDGPLSVITPEESGWYRAYVNNFLLEEPDSFMAKKFRNWFRLPYPSYKDLLHQITSDDRFERWCGYKWNAKTDNEFELLSYDKEGNVVTVHYNGVYIIVDNGHLPWSCTVPPLSVSNKIDETRWSRWVESMRKDVECTFGNLKGRWRILKMGVRLHGVDKVDDIWLTCCALHNWLLDIDGLSDKWNDGVLVRDWDGELGQMDFDGLGESIPNLIARLSTNLDPRNYDSPNMGPGEDVVGKIYHGDRGEEEEIEHGVMTPVNSTSLVYFRRQLVVHFSIMFARNLIKWPRNRNKKWVDRDKLFY